MSTASFKEQSAPLCFDFGESFARRKFGDKFVDCLPRYKRGKNKGKIKGEIVWLKCINGGWVSRGGGRGFVENRKNQIVNIAIRIGDKWKGFEIVAQDDCGRNHNGRIIYDLCRDEFDHDWSNCLSDDYTYCIKGYRKHHDKKSYRYQSAQRKKKLVEYFISNPQEAQERAMAKFERKQANGTSVKYFRYITNDTGECL